jgi:Cytochrome b(C-terminal)/b6/petD
MPKMPQVFRDAVNESTGPVIYTVGTTALLIILYAFRTWFVKPVIAWSIWNLMLLFLALSMPDPNFFAIVAKPDNVPIVALVFLLAFFTWLATYKAVENDRRMEAGEPPLEKLDDEKILVWPDLVYTEMICMIALSAVLIFWAIWLQAPLEEPASSVKTPNPSKAPWYFLGLQEMLVYYDPWMAGVVLPSLIIVGLMAIPYIDFNKLGNGYYTIKQRRFAYITFQLGFLELWVTLIVLGTLLRGPNWNFFGPYEHWDAHKVEALNNVNLSDYVWSWWLGMSLPAVPQLTWIVENTPTWISSWLQPTLQFIAILFTRELPGTLLVLGYFIALPPIMAVTVLRSFYQRMGFIRYMVLANLLLFMASLPIKMVLRWSFNLKYLISVPEYFLNF